MLSPFIKRYTHAAVCALGLVMLAAGFFSPLPRCCPTYGTRNYPSELSRAFFQGLRRLAETG